MLANALQVLLSGPEFEILGGIAASSYLLLLLQILVDEGPEDRRESEVLGVELILCGRLLLP